MFSPRLILMLTCALSLTACGEDDGDDGDSDGNGGRTVTLGADLNNVPTSEVPCSAGYPVQINPTFPQPFPAQGAQSCTLINFLPPQAPGLGSGVARRANIRVGATTGPMRFLRMRQLFQQPGPVECCSLEEYGPVFTPSANAITTVNLGFRMTEEPTPAPNDFTIIANDVIALEVLAPNVPIPGFWTQNGGQDFAVADYIYLPSLSEQNVPAPSNQLLQSVGYSGFVTLFNIDYTAND